MNHTLLTFLLAVGALGAVACAKKEPSATTTTSVEQMTMPPASATDEACPVLVPGTSVSTADTTDGMEMTFTTTRGDVVDLRRRVGAMADQMNARSSMAHGAMMGSGNREMPMGGMGMGPHGGMMMQGWDGGAGMMPGPMPPTRAQVESVDGGARLRLSPHDASGLDQMRTHMHQRTQMMSQGACPATSGR